jgi:hypothetical protein
MIIRRAMVLVAVTIAAGTAATLSAREFTFEERVRAQEAIERVYYAHQIGATKPFEEAVPKAALTRRADDTPSHERQRGVFTTLDALSIDEIWIRAVP